MESIKLFAVLLLLSLIPLNSCIESKAEVSVLTTKDICCLDPVPADYIHVDDRWNPTTCGNPTTYTHNVCVVEKYSDKAVGSRMTVCATAPIPSGWESESTAWQPQKCGKPTTYYENIRVIKRVK